jgi:hypothetical protein
MYVRVQLFAPAFARRSLLAIHSFFSVAGCARRGCCLLHGCTLHGTRS